MARASAFAHSAFTRSVCVRAASATRTTTPAEATTMIRITSERGLSPVKPLASPLRNASIAVCRQRHRVQQA
jgi:hypothetical protein